MGRFFSSISRMILFSVFAALACGLIPFGAPAAVAAQDPASSVFRDPYNGGTRLPEGGGEPGGAYMGFIAAAYRKDHAQICRLMADPSEVPQCLQQKEALDSYIAMFTQPKRHSVLGGFMKGEEATLDVAYDFASAPRSSGFVVMKLTKGRWIISRFGGSGSGTVSAGATGQVDLGSSSTSGSAMIDETGEFALINISADKKDYTGRCPVNITWTAGITFKMPLPDKFSYHWELSNGRKTPNTVVRPPRSGHMSVREVWTGGRPGEEHNASVRFVAESGGNSMTLDPPGVKVMCR